MGPVEILYCWQSVLCAMTAWGLAQLVKTSIDVWYGRGDLGRGTAPTMDTKLVAGKTVRKASVVINRIVLPVVPVVVGAVFAMAVPARPDVLTTHVAAHVEGWTGYLIYAAWGAACGQFASFAYDKIRDLLQKKVAAAIEP